MTNKIKNSNQRKFPGCGNKRPTDRGLNISSWSPLLAAVIKPVMGTWVEEGKIVNGKSRSAGGLFVLNRQRLSLSIEFRGRNSMRSERRGRTRKFASHKVRTSCAGTETKKRSSKNVNCWPNNDRHHRASRNTS